MPVKIVGLNIGDTIIYFILFYFILFLFYFYVFKNSSLSTCLSEARLCPQKADSGVVYTWEGVAQIEKWYPTCRMRAIRSGVPSTK
jgi:hypothetical protein